MGTLRPAHSIADQLHLACPKISCSVQKFVTGLLDAVDNLERALESVPADAEQQKKDPSNLLHGLRDGIVLTQKSLEKVCQQDRSAWSSAVDCKENMQLPFSSFRRQQGAQVPRFLSSHMHAGAECQWGLQAEG